ncbi:MAG TPA: PrsW family intramembrane metalloprotease [Streptosporangiaceae bacterium]|jgi:rRNA maturation endonuclease Nob1|nr:PrsW family intramembrane metalloprotease [Streptosporangiaceae bacterium]
MTSPADAGQAGEDASSFRMTTCPHCGNTVPDAPFCGACGAHLAAERGKGAAARTHAYSAFPDEGMFRLAVVSSLFPRLAGRSRPAFRVAFGLVAIVLVIMAVAGLQAPVIALSAVAVPLLFLLYVYEIDPLEAGFVAPTAIIFVAGAALGVAWGLISGPVVASSLLPGYAVSLAGAGVLWSAVAIPAIGQLLMLVPVVITRLWRAARNGALDGFTAGAAGALGLTMAATLTEMTPLLRNGNLVTGSSALATLTEAVIRGISGPLVAAAATGYVGAALWHRRGSRSVAGGRWLTSPLLALAVALVVQAALGLADAAVLPDAVLLIVHLAAAAAALLVLRIGLHHLLLHEHREVQIGPPRVCPHCRRVVPAMPFCPMCGVAEGATTLAGDRQLGHRRILAVLISGLALITGALVVIAAVLPPVPTVPCTSLSCFAPFGPLPVHMPHLYTSAEGWTVQWYPASAVFSQNPPQTAASSSPSQLRLDFTSPVSPAEDGTLFFVGLAAHGKSPNEIVTTLQQANAPNAVPDYVLPGASVGYQTGYGAAFRTVATSANGNPVTFEVVIICAERHNYAICAYAAGPRADLSKVVSHPTPSKLALSLWTDPDLNGVRWKGETLP